MPNPKAPQEDVAGVALGEEHRSLWIRTILAMAGTEPQRHAFIDGYNGYDLSRPASLQMRENHGLGRRVRTHLQGGPNG